MNEKYVNVDDIIEFCNNYSSYLQGKGQGVTQAALRRIKEFAKENIADVQPVKHGRWMWDSNAPYREHGAYKCSICGCHSDFEENYCYNCGARMIKDGEKNG